MNTPSLTVARAQCSSDTQFLTRVSDGRYGPSAQDALAGMMLPDGREELPASDLADELVDTLDGNAAASAQTPPQHLPEWTRADWLRLRMSDLSARISDHTARFASLCTSGHDPLPLREVYLLQLLVNLLADNTVAHARETGLTWRQIADLTYSDSEDQTYQRYAQGVREAQQYADAPEQWIYPRSVLLHCLDAWVYQYRPYDGRAAVSDGLPPTREHLATATPGTGEQPQ